MPLNGLVRPLFVICQPEGSQDLCKASGHAKSCIVLLQLLEGYRVLLKDLPEMDTDYSEIWVSYIKYLVKVL